MRVYPSVRRGTSARDHGHRQGRNAALLYLELMNPANDSSSELRPANVCRALLAALEAAEGRRRQRKRDQTPDAFGLALKRDLLRQAVEDDPRPEALEEWLLHHPLTRKARELVGPSFAMGGGGVQRWRLSPP